MSVSDHIVPLISPQFLIPGNCQTDFRYRPLPALQIGPKYDRLPLHPGSTAPDSEDR
jgi:hypothetical protein